MKHSKNVIEDKFVERSLGSEDIENKVTAKKISSLVTASQLTGIPRTMKYWVPDNGRGDGYKFASIK